MRVLVTGGAGYVGSHTCQRLAEAGFTPITVDNLVYGHREAVQWGPFHKADIADQRAIETILRHEKIEAVLHFAAYAYVGESVQHPLKYYENNTIGTLKLLTAMKNTGVCRIVFSSTCATYGIPERTPIEENFPQNPINPYGQSKLMVEKILQDFSKAHAIEATALRYFNASGADPNLQIGEDHHPETHLIPLALMAAYQPQRQLTIFGSDYATPDGTCVRDYIHVSDLADAHVLALKKGPAACFRAFNLGTGRGSSVQEVIDMVTQVTGKKVHVRRGDRRAGDPPILVASGEKAMRDLGWKPRQSDLRTIVETADRWHQKHFIQRESAWKSPS